ncbi:MAG: hypothetical protein J7K77_04075, partial [Dehalococcoidales bacterium]|nr:hypothetical protein [Dehalococcoidales bacterium]
TAQAIEVTITFVLVLITAIYVKRTAEIAKSTKEQADASVKMAKEMREQRYDAVRPIIDIQRDRGLVCILHNIGLGPAIDVRSFIQYHKQERRPWEFGTLTSGGKTEEMILSLEHEDNRMVLVAYYKDIYGRRFESSREVSIGETPNSNWVIGPLKIRPVKEDE